MCIKYIILEHFFQSKSGIFHFQILEFSSFFYIISPAIVEGVPHAWLLCIWTQLHDWGMGAVPEVTARGAGPARIKRPGWAPGFWEEQSLKVFTHFRGFFWVFPRVLHKILKDKSQKSIMEELTAKFFLFLYFLFKKYRLKCHPWVVYLQSFGKTGLLRTFSKVFYNLTKNSWKIVEVPQQQVYTWD